jgi:hypothetical protein
VTWRSVVELIGEQVFDTIRLPTQDFLDETFDMMKLLIHKKATAEEILDIFIRVSNKFGSDAICSDFFSAEYHALLGWLSKHRNHLTALDLLNAVKSDRHWLTQCMIDLPRRLDTPLIVHLCSGSEQKILTTDTKYSPVISFMNICENAPVSERVSSTPSVIGKNIWNPCVTNETLLDPEVFVRRHESRVIDSLAAETRIKKLLRYTGFGDKECELLCQNPMNEDAYMVLAGGSVSASLSSEEEFNRIAYPKDNGLSAPATDLDFFIVGKSVEAKKTLMLKVQKYFVEELDCTIKHNGSVFQIHGLDRECQVILSEYSSAESLIQGFDSSHIACFFDFSYGIRVSPAFNAFTHRNETLLTKFLIVGYRFIKNLNRGYIPLVGREFHSVGGYGNAFNYSTPLDIHPVKEATSFEDFVTSKLPSVADGEDPILPTEEQLVYWQIQHDSITHTMRRVSRDIPEDEKESHGYKSRSIDIYSKNKMTQWTKVSLSESEELITDMKCLKDGMFNYESCGRYLPWLNDDEKNRTSRYIFGTVLLRNARFEEYLESSVTESCPECKNWSKTKKLHLLDCKKCTQSDTKMVISGIFELNPLNDKDDDEMVSIIHEKFLKENDRMLRIIKDLTAKYDKQFIDISNQLSKLYTGKSTPKTVKKIKMLETRLDQIRTSIHGIYKSTNRFNPSIINNSAVSELAFNYNSHSRDTIYDRLESKKNDSRIFTIPSDELPNLLIARFKKQSYTSVDGIKFPLSCKAVRVRVVCDVPYTMGLFVKNSDGSRFHSSEFVLDKTSQFNVSLHCSNFNKWFIKTHDDCIATANNNYSKSTVKLIDILSDYMKNQIRPRNEKPQETYARIAMVCKSDEFKEYIGQNLCYKLHRDEGLLGKSPIFDISQIFHISN